MVGAGDHARGERIAASWNGVDAVHGSTALCLEHAGPQASGPVKQIADLSNNTLALRIVRYTREALSLGDNIAVAPGMN